MNGTSLTNTVHVNDFWHIGFSDYVAWAIGIIAIIIAVAIYIRQKEVNKKIDAIKKSTISVSLGRINLSFELIREGIDSDVGVVRLSVGDNENKIRVATILRENQKTFYSQSIEHMTKEADFLKGKIDPFILAQIEYILQLVKKHSTYEISSIQLTATQSLEIWYGLCTEIINKIDEVRRPIAKLIEF